MAVKRVALGEWTPDMPSTIGKESTGLADVINVYPNNVGYSPFPSTVDITNEATEELTSVYAGKDGATVQVFAGSDTKLWKAVPLTARSVTNVADVSKSGGYASSDDSWHFETFGNSLRHFATLRNIWRHCRTYTSIYEHIRAFP